MSNLQSNLVINDEEYLSYGEIMDLMYSNAEAKLEFLIHQLQYVNTEGIKSGTVHENLELFINKLIAMRGQFRIFTEAYAKEAEDFIKDVEKEDRSFYKGGVYDEYV